MASALIHIAVAKEINHVLHKNEKELFLGAIAPDISKQIGETKIKSHFLDGNNNDIPNLTKFLNKYQHNLNKTFILGYYIHLYTDYLWFKYFIPNIIKGNYIKELDGTLVEYTEKTFKYYVYNDYSNLNNQLIDRYNFPMKIFYEEIPYIPNIISEIPIDRLNLIVDKTGVLIEESKKGKKYLFKIDDIITFIESSKKTILKELDSIYEKN